MKLTNITKRIIPIILFQEFQVVKSIQFSISEFLNGFACKNESFQVVQTALDTPSNYTPYTRCKMNPDHATKEIKQVAILHKFMAPPWGGGNQFLMALRDGLSKNGV